jgi:HSP20 family protein
MPAFGPTDGDQDIWQNAACLRHRPQLTGQERTALHAAIEAFRAPSQAWPQGRMTAEIGPCDSGVGRHGIEVAFLRPCRSALLLRPPWQLPQNKSRRGRWRIGWAGTVLSKETIMVRGTLKPVERRIPSLMHDGPHWFDTFRQEMDRLVENFFGEEERGGTMTPYLPPMNVAEAMKHYEITMDLPGMKQEDITVELREGDLMICGERKQEKEEGDKTYHRQERSYGRFCRTFPIGPDVKPEQIAAEYKDGVLRITVPKSEATQPKKIPIKVGK